MIRFLLLALSLFSTLFTAQSQSRLNVDLYRWLQQVPEDSCVALMIQGKTDRLRELTEQHNGWFKYQAGDIASVRLSAKAIRSLAKHTDIRRMEAYFAPLHHFHQEDSSVLYNNNLSPVHQGWGDLPHPYQGEGTLVGVIDDGFDWQHPDFRYADGRTRVRYLWDQNTYDAFNLETLFGYGSAWDSLAIQNGQTLQTPGSHGTHVAGIAAGNALATGRYIGVAPQANMLWVKIANGQGWMSAFVDGLTYMYMRADELGMPCAINSSLGTYTGGHDGKDLYSRYIHNLINDQPGRIFVQAAGNAREYPFHLGVTQTDTAYTWFKRHAQAGRTHFYLYADTADFNDLDFSLQWIDGSSHLPLASTVWYNVKRDIPIGGAIGHLSQHLFTDAQGHQHTLDVYVGEYEGVYEMYVSIQEPVSSNCWQFKTKGTGKYDVWSHPDLVGTSEIVQQGAGIRYQRPDSMQSLAGFWTCHESVITVAAYQNQSEMVNYAQDTFVLNTQPQLFPTGGIWFRSSLGPTRDGRQKPDITAPGGQVISAIPLDELLYYQSIGYPKLDMDGWHYPNQGTSMAAPMVAGAAALYLQCNPFASQSQIKQRLQTSARIDSLTLRQGTVFPNIHWGYGKLDAFQLLQSCLIYGCTDTLAVNYDPAAMVDDGSCVILPDGIHQPNAPQNVLIIAPSCTNNQQGAVIRHQLQPSDLPARMELWDIWGRSHHLIPLTTPAGEWHWQPTHALAAGVYWWVVRNDTHVLGRAAMVIGN